jgi:ABC-type spermidine/putrescine transport system permease subunit II
MSLVHLAPGITSVVAFALTLSQHNVVVALGTLGEPFEETVPTGAVGARVVPDILPPA